MITTLESRFWSKVNRSPGCWLWTGEHTTHPSHSYGVFRFAGQRQRAHRVAYEMAYGPIPDGMVVCHQCDVPLCVRPDHLFVGSQAENNDDMHRKGRGFRLPPLRGAAHPLATLSEADVRTIRQLGRAGIPQRRIADQFGVTQAQIWRIIAGRSWRSVA